MTITIEVPEDLAARAAAIGIDLDQVNRIATAATVGAVTAIADQAEEELDQASVSEVVAAGRESLEDEKSGRLMTLDQVGEEAEAFFRNRKQALGK